MHKQTICVQWTTDLRGSRAGLQLCVVEDNFLMNLNKDSRQWDSNMLMEHNTQKTMSTSNEQICAK